MSDIHDLHDDLPPSEYHRIGEALRRHLRAAAVPHDDAHADAMIRIATEVRASRLARWAAPVGTAAAILAVGAGVAIFAATGGTDNAAPPAGHPVNPSTPTSTWAPGAYGSVLCVAAYANGHAPAPRLMPMSVAKATRRPLDLHPPKVRAAAPLVTSSTAVVNTRRVTSRVRVAPPTTRVRPGRPEHSRLLRPLPSATCAAGRGGNIVGCVTAHPLPTRTAVLPGSTRYAIGCPPVGRGILRPVRVPSAALSPASSASPAPGSASPPQPAGGPTCTGAPGADVWCATARAVRSVGPTPQPK